MRTLPLAVVLVMAAVGLHAPLDAVHADEPDTRTCGELATVSTHDGTTTRYVLAPAAQQAPERPRVVLVLLAGGSGHVRLDERGCAQGLKGNMLVRSVSLFNAAGFATALVDAPSDRTEADGLGGFRIDPRHAADLGRVITDVRQRTRASVWLVGTSRGSISAANAASRLSGSSAPDGVVLSSVLMSGDDNAYKAWVAQTVFDLPLETIRVPVLVIGHAEDKCIRSPASHMNKVDARLHAARKQVVTVTGGPGRPGRASLSACVGRSPHGYVNQEEEVIAGIARFIAGGSY